MNKIKLPIIVILVTVLVMTVFIGCKGALVQETVAGEITTEATTAAATTAAETTAAATTSTGGEPITVTMWDYQNVENWSIAYDEIIKKFQEKYPNVTIQRLAQSHEEGEPKIKAAALAGNLPDLVPFEPGEPFNTAVTTGLIQNFEPFVKADPEWASWVALYQTDPWVSYNGQGIWRIAADRYQITSFYYKDISQQNGLIDPPLKLSDLEANGQILSGKEIVPIGSSLQGGFAESVVFGVFYCQLVGDVQKAWDTYTEAAKGQISWENDDFKTALDGLVRLSKLHTIDAVNYVYGTDDYDRIFNKKDWYYMYMGSWMLGELETKRAEDAKAGNIGVALYPAVNDNVDPIYYCGGIGAHYSLNAKLEEGTHLDMVLKWAKFINSPDASEIFLKHDVMPAGAAVQNPEQFLNPLTVEFLKVVSKGKQVPVEWGIGNIIPELSDPYYTGLTKLVTGEETVDQFLTEMNNICGYKGQ